MTQTVSLVIEPDPDDPGCADVMVDGMLDGRPYRFVLDTGGARTYVVADDFLTALTGSGAVRSAGVFAPNRNAMVRVSELVVGPVRATDVEVALIEAAQPGARNLLGMDVLKNFQCHFRFDSATLVIDDAVGADGMRPLLMDDASHPYVEVTWPGVTANSVWDSGAGITIVDRAFWSEHRGLFEDLGSSVGTDSTGAQVETQTYTVAAPRIGGQQFDPHKVAVVDLSEPNSKLDRPMDMILGYPALRQANWLFDFPRRQWRITSRV
jgi:hypothetical protein